MGFDQCNSVRFSFSCPDMRVNDHLDPWVKPAFPSPLPRAATHLKDNPPKTDVAVEAIVKAYAADEFPAGQTVTFGLKEDGVGLSEMEHTKDLIPQAILDQVEAAKQSILSGETKVWNVVEQGYPDWLK